MALSESSRRCQQFIRGCFVELNRVGISSALLHDWREGEMGMGSDVDFVIEQSQIASVPSLIERYCKEAGWRLCQVLWHETTAAYCVCSAIDDPGCVVALDACSDFQRDGHLLMSAGELLEQRQRREWGGFGLDAMVELRYRFLKAAIKGKDAAGIGAELSGYSDGAKDQCRDWLQVRWGVTLDDWTKESLERSFADLDARTRKRTTLFNLPALSRVLKRALRPTGLIVSSGGGKRSMAEVREVFGKFYFRHVMEVDRLPLKGVYALVRSTLIFVPGIPGVLKSLFGSGMVVDLARVDDGPDAIAMVAEHLHRRCLRRERIS